MYCQVVDLASSDDENGTNETIPKESLHHKQIAFKYGTVISKTNGIPIKNDSSAIEVHHSFIGKNDPNSCLENVKIVSTVSNRNRIIVDRSDGPKFVKSGALRTYKRTRGTPPRNGDSKKIFRPSKTTPIQCKSEQQPSMMPIIVNTRSLSVDCPKLPGEITIMKTNSMSAVSNNNVESTPLVTITKNSEILDTKAVLDSFKSIPVINLDDEEEEDDDDDNENVSAHRGVVPIEFENDSKSTDVDSNEDSTDKERASDDTDERETLDIIDSHPSENESSEKENSQPSIVKHPESPEPPSKKIKFDQFAGSSVSKTNSETIEGVVDDDVTHTVKNREGDSIPISPNRTTDKTEKNSDSENDNRSYLEIDKIYKNLLKLCLKMEDSEIMKKIIDNRLIRYYDKLDKQYAASDEFLSFIKSKMADMRKNPQYLYMYIKDIVDELKIHCSKTSPKKSEAVDTPTNNTGREGKILKLQSIINFLNGKIKKLEETEVDDDSCSAYIQCDKYKRRIVRCYEKLRQLKNETKCENDVYKVLSTIPINIGIPNLMQRLKKKARTSPYWFPDFCEIKKNIEECAAKAEISIQSQELQRKAQYVFITIGDALQKSRKTEVYQEYCEMLALNGDDPADKDPALAKALERNKIYHKRIDEVINKYAEIDCEWSSPEKKNDNTVVNNSNSQESEEVKVKNEKPNKNLMKDFESPNDREDKSKDLQESKDCKKNDDDDVIVIE